MIFGILGKKRSGKDEFAKYLAEYYADNNVVVIDKFARLIKCALVHSINKATTASVTYADINGDTTYDREYELFDLRDALCIFECSLCYLNIKISPREVVNAVVDYKKHELKCTGLDINTLEFSIRDLMKCLGTDLVRNLYSDTFWIDSVNKEYQELIDDDPTSIIIISDARFDNECYMIVENGGSLIEVQSKRSITDDHISENGVTKYKDIVQFVKNDSTLSDLKLKAIEIGKQHD